MDRAEYDSVTAGESGPRDPHIRDIVRTGGIAFFNRVCGAGLGFLAGILAARLLGAEALGLYSLGITCMTVGSIVGRIGLDNVLVRRVAAEIGADDWSGALAARRTVMVLALAGSAAISAILAGLAAPIAVIVFDKPGLATPLLVCALAILPFSALSLLVASLNAAGRAAPASLVQAALPQLGIVAGLGLATVAGARWDAADMSALHLAAILASTVAAWLIWRRVAAGKPAAPGGAAIRPMLAAGLPLLWVTLVGVATVTVDILMLGLWREAETLGHYAAAAHTAGLMALILVATNGVVAPKIAHLHAQGRMTQMSAVVRGASFLMAAAMLPVLLLFLGAPGLVMRLYGPGFEAGAAALAILAIGQFVNVACGPVGYMLIMTGHERLLRNITLMAGIMNVVLNSLLIPDFGAVGAAIATAASMAALNLVATIHVYRKFSINMIALFDPGAARAALSGGIVGQASAGAAPVDAKQDGHGP